MRIKLHFRILLVFVSHLFKESADSVRFSFQKYFCINLIFFQILPLNMKEFHEICVNFLRGSVKKINVCGDKKKTYSKEQQNHGKFFFFRQKHIHARFSLYIRTLIFHSIFLYKFSLSPILFTWIHHGCSCNYSNNSVSTSLTALSFASFC